MIWQNMKFKNHAITLTRMLQLLLRSEPVMDIFSAVDYHLFSRKGF
jgi:hypothetical protein